MRKLMNMRIVVVFLGLISFQMVFSQVPIGKDIQKGKAEFIAFMKSNGFNLYKEVKEHNLKYNKSTGKNDIPVQEHYRILFKEEVKVDIYFNEYGNITEIYIFPESAKNKEKVLSILKFQNWQFLYDRKDFFGTDKVYKVDNYYAMIPNTKILQINFYNSKPL